MEQVRVAPREELIRQGEKGDFFYVVERGTFDVLVHGQLVGSVADGGAFGELALLYNCPRAATVTARAGGGVVWALDRVSFRHLLRHDSHVTARGVMAALRTVPLLAALPEDQQAFRDLVRGRAREAMFSVVRETSPLLPAGKPRYLMGVGYPDDIVGAAARGVD